MVDCRFQWLYAHLTERGNFQIRTITTAFPGGEVTWRVLGTGSKCMLAFHGFGQTGKAFYPLAEALPDTTIYALDLPFHGFSMQIDKSEPWCGRDILQMVDVLQKSEDFERFSMVGYSIGAKVAFAILEEYFTRVQGLVLIAPDGISRNFWYSLATQNRLMRRVFRRVLAHKFLFKNLMHMTSAMGLVSSESGELAHYTVENRRQQVYDTWCFFRRLRWRKNQGIRLINKYQVPIIIVLGSDDKVIPKKGIIKFSLSIPSCQIVTLEGGHHQLIRLYANRLIGQVDEMTH